MLSQQTKRTRAVVKATRQDSRRQNLQVALQFVYREGLTSRARISQLTGLTRAAVSDLMGELLEADLVSEVGPGTSSGGKPPTMLQLNPRGRDIVAVDVSGLPFRGAVIDLSGKVQRRAFGRADGTNHAGIDEVFRLVRSLVGSASAPILGIGVGTPGIVDHDGTVLEAANLDWHGVPLQKQLADRFELPVRVANDSHVAALAEFGARPGESLAVVKIGVGIGVGMVVNGQLFTGNRPAAGEIGHIRVVDAAQPCTCGNHGCLETVASVPSIIRHAAAASGKAHSQPATLPWDFAGLAQIFGEEPVRSSLHAAGSSLGSVLAHLVAILDMHEIVLALELHDPEDVFLRAVRAEVGSRVLPSLAPVIEISSTSFGSDLVLAGAAALVLREELGVVWQ